MTTGYKGRLNGQPGPQHVRELQPRLSPYCPSGNGDKAPLTGYKASRNDGPISQSEIAERKQKRVNARVKAFRERAKLEGK